MTTRRSELIRGPKGYWGAGRTGKANSSGIVSEPLIRLKYTSGAIVESQLFTGAVAVIRGDAQILNGKKMQVLPTMIVVCRRDSLNGTPKQRVGAAIQVVDPGRMNSFFILLRGAESNPTIAKSMCRPVGKCTDTNESCGKCCNRKK